MNILDLNQEDFILHCLKGNESAVQFCQDIFSISQIWDDLVDRDNPVENVQINRMMWKALIEIPRNAFFYQNSLVLTQTLEIVMADWLDANELEKGNDDDRDIAFVLRDSAGTIVIQCARIIGGYDWMREVSPYVRRFVYDETLKSYKDKLPKGDINHVDG